MKKFLSLDIGGTSIKYGLIKENGDIIEKNSMDTPTTDLDSFLNKLITKINDYKEQIAGVSIACPGIIDSKSGLIKLIYALPFLEGINLKNLLEEKTGIKVSIENDGKSAALAEVWKGAGTDYKDILFIVCGTGIGGAIIKNREIHHGNSLASGEFGMMIMGEDKESGQLINWSQTSSTINLVNRAKSKLNLEDLNGEQLFDMEDSNNIAKELINEFYFNLAKGIYNLQVAYDPEAIILGGGISNREEFAKNVDTSLKNIHNQTGSSIRADVKKCHYKSDANLIGALYHFLQQNNKKSADGATLYYTH